MGLLQPEYNSQLVSHNYERTVRPDETRAKSPAMTLKKSPTVGFSYQLEGLTTYAGPDVRMCCPLLLYLFIEIILYLLAQSCSLGWRSLGAGGACRAGGGVAVVLFHRLLLILVTENMIIFTDE